MTIETPVLKIQKLHEDAKIPTYAHDGDAGFDLYSTTSEVVNPADKVISFPLGIAADIPKNWCVIFSDKSGLATKGIHVVGGVIDSIYTGEWVVMLVNNGPKGYEIKKGDKVAQGILYYAPQASIVEVEKITKETLRGSNGFGSTGK